jgi:hypothetical protein
MKSKPHPKPSNKKKSTQKKKYPLRGKSVVYRTLMESVASDDWKSMNNPPARIPGIDKGRVIIMPDFDAPLPGFGEE